MKALIPAGGAGTRLRPITHTSAKQLVPLANKPILFYVLDDVAEAGITDVGMVVAPETGGEIRDAVGDGSAWGLSVTYLPQEKPLGLAHTVLIARDFLGDDPFVMYLGDNVLRDGITHLMGEYDADPVAAQILVVQVADPTRFGVVELDGERVVRLVEKPADPPSNLALAGVYIFDANVHEAVRTLEPSARGELEITEAIQWLVDRGLSVRVRRTTGWWKDTGRLVDLLEANRLVLESLDVPSEGRASESSQLIGSVVLQRGAVVEGASVVRGPAIIGEGARIVDSFIGPFTSVGARCTIEDSEIEHSVIMPECVVTGIHRLEDSLLGRGVVVERSTGRPKAYRLMVGDHGRVEVE